MLAMPRRILLFVAVSATTLFAQEFKTLVNFHGSNGNFPLQFGALIQGIDGNMYGTTRSGGAYVKGTVFLVTPAGKLTTLYNFCSQNDCVDGANPYSGLTLATDGNFYGTTSQGGSQQAGGQYGTIFRITSKGVLTSLYSFPGTTGYPFSSLIQGSDGVLYGTTPVEVFKISLSGTFTILHTFTGPDGINAMAPLIQASDGNFYGTTAGGGAAGFGTIYRITPTGALSTLYSFCTQTNCPDGDAPVAPLIQALDGNLYGTTSGQAIPSCSNGCGTIFKVALDGTFTTLHVFSQADGAYSSGGVVQGTDGSFYGMTPEGGDYGLGTIYEMTPEGILTTLHNFSGKDGEKTGGQILQHTNGIFFGPTTEGGNINSGTLFSLNTGLGPFVSLVRNPTKAGKQFGILGQGFRGTTGVTLNVQSAPFTVKSDTLIIATVPQGATSGYGTVATPNGTLTSNVPFRVLN